MRGFESAREIKRKRTLSVGVKRWVHVIVASSYSSIHTWYVFYLISNSRYNLLRSNMPADHSPIQREFQLPNSLSPHFNQQAEEAAELQASPAGFLCSGSSAAKTIQQSRAYLLVFQGIVQTTRNLGVQKYAPLHHLPLEGRDNLLRKLWPLLDYRGSFRSQFNGHSLPSLSETCHPGLKGKVTLKIQN